MGIVHESAKTPNTFFVFHRSKTSRLSTGHVAQYFTCVVCQKVRNRKNPNVARLTVLDDRIATDPQVSLPNLPKAIIVM